MQGLGFIWNQDAGDLQRTHREAPAKPPEIIQDKQKVIHWDAAGSASTALIDGISNKCLRTQHA